MYTTFFKPKALAVNIANLRLFKTFYCINQEKKNFQGYVGTWLGTCILPQQIPRTLL